jgi:signal transduction histidine kinase
MATFSQFILQHIDGVVDEFEAFARTTGPSAEHLSSSELRDHARIVLEAVAADMATSQSASVQHEKAQGHSSPPFSRVRETACKHAQHRFAQEFTLPQMVSEYRALRASVIRRWSEQLEIADAGQLAELTRFGEAIDEGLTEAIAWYSKRLDDSRNLLIGAFAHDLRSPLGAIQMAAQWLLRTDRLQDGELRAVTRIASSSARMAGYVSDLLDFAQTLLGSGLPLARTEPVYLASFCEDVVEEVRAAHPEATVGVEVLGTPEGSWDAARLSQLLSNLVTNAIIHGEAERPVTVTVAEADGLANIAVHNEGPPIPSVDLPTLFQPLLERRPGKPRHHGSSGLGLGLYIAREIALAHGGVLDVASDAESGTTFTVRLPLACPERRRDLRNRPAIGAPAEGARG